MDFLRIARFRKHAEQIPPDAHVELVEPDGPSLEEVYLQAATAYLSTQTSSYDVLDGKASQSFSVASITLPITFTLINLAPDRVHIPNLAIWSLWGAIVAYLGLIYCIIRAGRYTTIDVGPSPEDLKETGQEAGLPGQVMQRWVADGYVASARINNETLAGKSKWIGRAQLCLWVEGIALALAAVFTLSLGL